MSVSAISPAASQQPQQAQDLLKKAAEELKRQEENKPKAKDGETLSPIGTLNVISGRWKPPKASSSSSSESGNESKPSGTSYDSIA